MLFSSPEFLFVFLPITLIGFHVAARSFGRVAGLLFLLIASLAFYGWWDPRYLPLILGSILFNFVLGRHVAQTGGRALLALGVTANLALLGVFKYADFAVANINAVTGASIPQPEIVLPLAISFFTFQQIAFLVDTARSKTKPDDPASYSLFVAFFPQLIAGPIVHHATLRPQFARLDPRKALSENLSVGLSIFAIGLAKKVLIADTLAPHADNAFNAAAAGEPVGFWLAWSGALAYTFQIFFDFSGYSDMALGLGRMLGVRLPINFNAPYRARSVTEFWRRWHITLSQFLRDYLYIPLGGNRKGPGRQTVNMMIVMLLGGLWHGAAWTFVIWGGLHGLALAWCRMLDRRLPGGLFPAIPQLAVASTFLFTVVTWVFFRAEGFDAAWTMLGAMAGAHGLGAFPGDEAFIAAAVCGLIVWLLPDTAPAFRNHIDAETLAAANVTDEPRIGWRPGRVSGAMLAVLLAIAALNTWSVDEFIYYDF
jgi:D-alanyl-lipoteichoic acid acyltransferase DltB (MBOAT superfamily)